MGTDIHKSRDDSKVQRRIVPSEHGVPVIVTSWFIIYEFRETWYLWECEE